MIQTAGGTSKESWTVDSVFANMWSVGVMQPRSKDVCKGTGAIEDGSGRGEASSGDCCVQLLYCSGNGRHRHRRKRIVSRGGPNTALDQHGLVRWSVNSHRPTSNVHVHNSHERRRGLFQDNQEADPEGAKHALTSTRPRLLF